MASEKEFIYIRLARELRQGMEKGVYAPGERLPSLRQLARQQGVSLASVLQSYQRLEQEGLIEARPKSGFFVSTTTTAQAKAPDSSHSSNNATLVNVGELALSLISETKAPGLIRLGAAVPSQDMLPLQSLSRSLSGCARRNWAQTGRYESPQGDLGLRRQIARLMRQAGCSCSADDILITNGCLEALTLALRICTRPGDTVAIESPTYFGILQVMESLGLKALELATHPTQGIDVCALEKVIASQKISACVLMPCYHNPLGCSMSNENKQRTVSLLNQANIPLIEDDVYGPLTHGRSRPKAAKAYDEKQQVILCSSFSKTIAPGFRLGWMLTEKYMEAAKYQKFLDNICTAVLPQQAMAEFLKKGGYSRTLRRNGAIYQHRMQQLRHWISKYFPAQTRISDPQGGFVLWVELPRHINALKLYHHAREKGIAISPGILFSARKQYQHHLRLSCGAVDGEQMQQALRKLAKLMNSL